MPPFQLTCAVCHTNFRCKYSHGRYCSEACERTYRKQKTFGKNPYAHLAAATVGALNELRAATDLMMRGYEVFRALSPSCSCDLAVLYEGKLLRIEVRTGHKYLQTGKIYCATREDEAHRYDHLAIVLTDEIVYRPTLPP